VNYNVAFSWGGSRLFPQEYAPFGDLSRHIGKPGLKEEQIKMVAQQLGLALEFVHSMNLVHRNVIPENVLVFQKDFSLVKLSDFGQTVGQRSLLTKAVNDKEEVVAPPTTATITDGKEKESNKASKSKVISLAAEIPTDPKKLATLPPEICGMLPGERYHSYSSSDVWQFGILVYTMFSGGTTPWRMADSVRDPAYSNYVDWLKRRSVKTPLAFQPFTSRFLRLLKRLFEPKPTKRCKVNEVSKYLKDEWLNPSSSKAIFSLERSPSMAITSAYGLGRSKSDAGDAASSRSRVARAASCRKSNSTAGIGAARKKGIGTNNAVVKGRNDDADKPVKEPVFKITCKFEARPMNVTNNANNVTTCSKEVLK